MDDAGDVSKNRQQDVEPEVTANSNLQKDAERGENNGGNDPGDVDLIGFLF